MGQIDSLRSELKTAARVNRFLFAGQGVAIRQDWIPTSFCFRNQITIGVEHEHGV